MCVSGWSIDLSLPSSVATYASKPHPLARITFAAQTQQIKKTTAMPFATYSDCLTSNNNFKNKKTCLMTTNKCTHNGDGACKQTTTTKMNIGMTKTTATVAYVQ